MIGNRRTLERLAGGGFAYVFIDEAVRLETRHLRREHHQLYAEVDVEADWAGARKIGHSKSVSCADLNLSSQPARKALAKYCAERAQSRPEDFDWMEKIDAACVAIIAADRQGDDVIVLDDAPAVTERDFDVHGLRVPADAASLLVAHGDSLKSMILLFILGALAQRGQQVLYVDWEWTADRHRARKLRLFGPDRIEELHYQRCRAPLVVEADRIRRFCDLHHVTFLGIDSVGLACDGKLIDDDVAIRFHRALSTLPPALCAAHVPKSAIGADVKTDPQAFGSVYFSNLCRASWAVKKQPGATDDLVTVGLFPNKQNDGQRQRAVGLNFTFTSDRIDVQSVDLATVDGLAARLPIHLRMVGLLKRGPLTFAQIADELSEKVDSVIKAAKRSDAFTKVSGTDGVTRLALVERRVA